MNLGATNKQNSLERQTLVLLSNILGKRFSFASRHESRQNIDNQQKFKQIQDKIQTKIHGGNTNKNIKS
jgi:hypothetical protein